MCRNLQQQASCWPKELFLVSLFFNIGGKEEKNFGWIYNKTKPNSTK